MAKYEAVDTRKMTLGGTSSEENFDGICTSVIVRASAACYIDFDKPADTGSIPLDSDDGLVQIFVPFTRITGITSGGTVTLWVTGVR